MINASRVRLGRMEDLKLIMTDKIALAPVRTLSKARDPSACRSSATKLGGDPLWKWDKLADNVLLGFSLFNAAAALVHHYIWYDAVLRA